MPTKNLDGCRFVFVQTLVPERDAAGNIVEVAPQPRYKNTKGLPLNPNGGGTFCRFSIGGEWRGKQGVYALFICDTNTPVYIGKCVDLYNRFNAGYGNISPRNCYQGGQPTNCRINKAVLENARTGNVINVFFYETKDKERLESTLIEKYQPQYNVQGLTS